MKHLTQSILAIQLGIALFSLVSCEPDGIRVKVGTMKKLKDKILFQGRVSADGILVMNQQDLENLAKKAANDAVHLVHKQSLYEEDIDSNDGDRRIRSYRPEAAKTALKAISVPRSEVIPIDDLRLIGAKAARKTLEDLFDKFVLEGEGKKFWDREIKNGEIYYFLKPKKERRKYREPFDIIDVMRSK